MPGDRARQRGLYTTARTKAIAIFAARLAMPADCLPMGGFQRVYTDQQRAAVTQAVTARGIRSPRTLAALAAAGELTLDGELVPAFTLTEASARHMRERAERDQAKRLEKARAIAPGVDGVEEYRRRLAVIAERQLAHMEELQSRKRFREIRPADIGALAKALAQLAAIPAPGDRSPGARPTREHRAPEHSSGLADQLRATLAPGAIAAPADDEPEHHTSDSGERDDGAGGDVYTSSAGSEDSEDPGTFARARIAGLTGELASVRPAGGR